MYQQIIKIDSNSEPTIIKLFKTALNKGYLLKKAYSRKKYLLFGTVRYYIVMELDVLGYSNLIHEAIEREDYESAKYLSSELQKRTNLIF